MQSIKEIVLPGANNLTEVQLPVVYSNTDEKLTENDTTIVLSKVIHTRSLANYFFTLVLLSFFKLPPWVTTSATYLVMMLLILLLYSSLSGH